MSIAEQTEAIISAQRSALCARPSAYTALRIVLGLLLLTAAGLKLSGLNVTALPRIGWFSSPQVQIFAVEWELVLGIWLLSGAYLFGSWLAAIGTFSIFAIVSGYFGWIGVASCGCFGAIKASPWTAFGVDVAALAFLVIARPPFQRTSLRFAGSASRIPLASVAILVVMTLTGSMLYGSPAAALAKLRGDTLTVSADYVDFGTAMPGEVREAIINVQNWSTAEVRLIGGTSDCSCVTTVDLPVAIPAGEVHAVTIRIRMPNSNPGAFTRRAELWTDSPKQATLFLQIGGKLAKAEQ